MTILSGLLCLDTWLQTSSISVLIAFVSFYGVCSGVFIAVLPVIVAQITPNEKLGGRIGAFYSFCAIAQLVGSPIGGALINKSGGEEENGGRHSEYSFEKLIQFAVGTFARLDTND
jgi:MFS family permease